MRRVLKMLLSSILIMVLMMGFVTSVQAAHPSRMVDNADLLDADEESYVSKLLNELSNELQLDIVVVTTNSTDGKSARDYADDFFDYNGYGMGDTYDGALLLVNMSTREWYISTCGYGIKALNDSDIEDIGGETAYYLSDGEYEDAFVYYAEEVADEVRSKRDSEVLTIGEAIGRVFVAILAGGGLAFIPVSIMKKKLNNVKARNEASEYVRRDSIMMSEQRDTYLYQTVQRTAKPKDSGSSTHVGSSGRSHGGGGGRF